MYNMSMSTPLSKETTACRLFLGGLPVKVSTAFITQSLHCLIAHKLGKPSAELIRGIQYEPRRGYAFVGFHNEDDTNVAFSLLMHQTMPEYPECFIRVERPKHCAFTHNSKNAQECSSDPDVSTYKNKFTKKHFTAQGLSASDSSECEVAATTTKRQSVLTIVTNNPLEVATKMGQTQPASRIWPEKRSPSSASIVERVEENHSAQPIQLPSPTCTAPIVRGTPTFNDSASCTYNAAASNHQWPILPPATSRSSSASLVSLQHKTPPLSESDEESRSDDSYSVDDDDLTYEEQLAELKADLDETHRLLRAKSSAVSGVEHRLCVTQQERDAVKKQLTSANLMIYDLLKKLQQAQANNTQLTAGTLTTQRIIKVGPIFASDVPTTLIAIRDLDNSTFSQCTTTAEQFGTLDGKSHGSSPGQGRFFFFQYRRQGEAMNAFKYFLNIYAKQNVVYVQSPYHITS